MPFLGQTPPSQFSSIAKQTITGNSGTTYTLDYSVTNSNELEVFVNNVRQEPGVAYTASGTSIVFSEAVASTDSIYVVYQGRSIGTAAPGDGSVNASTLSSALYNLTQYFKIPVGTTSQRPSSSTSGMTRLNSTTGAIEVYSGSTWQTLNASGSTTSYIAEVLLVAGGGGGKGESGGGGGAGGLVNLRTSFTIGTNYTCTVGAGGGSGSNGGVSQITGSGFSTLVADGGGVGGGSSGSSANGGSGGGGGWNNYLPGVATGLSNMNIGSSGGSNYTNAGRHGAGGGGAGKQGNITTGTDDKFNGAGGDGLFFGEWNVAGISGDGYFAGGGGGGGEYYTASSGKTVSSMGGAGGGGSGCYGGTPNTGGTNGRANVGGGAGGQCGNSTGGLSGGSGVVIIRYPGIQRGTGGTIHSSNGYTYHTFTSSGTYTA
jgi:hypothetical protein